MPQVSDLSTFWTTISAADMLFHSRRALEKTCATNHHQDQEWGTACHPSDPH